MDYNKLSQFRFWEYCDRALMKKRFDGARRISLYPSEARVIARDPETSELEVLGGCQRKSWYRIMGFKQSEPFTAKSAYIFEMGNYIETMIRDLVRNAGIYNNSSVKFWDASSMVSGEIDIVVEYPLDNEGNYVFTEVKSTWGGSLSNTINPETKQKELFETGSAKGLFDHPEGRGKDRQMVKAKPKEQNVLQILTYLYAHKDDPKLVGGKLVYFLRDNCNRTEFDVTIQQESNGKHRAVINGEVDDRYYVEDIYESFDVLKKKINEDFVLVKSGTKPEDLTPPDRDFALTYDRETVESMFRAGKLSKTKYENYLSGKETPGSWVCSYVTMAVTV